MNTKNASDKKPASAERVLEWLSTHPGWHTVKDIDADLEGVARGTISKALKGLWDRNEVRRLMGDKDLAKGTAEPDRWAHPNQQDDTVEATEPSAADTPPLEAAAETGITEEVPASPVTVTAEDSAAQESTPAAEASTVPESEPGSSADEDGADTDDDGPDEEGPVVEPVRLVAASPDVEVIAAAGVLGDHRDTGITVADLAAACGISLGVAWRIILAMDVAGAAVSGEAYVLDETAKWRPGDGDMSAVRISDAPTTVLCPTCNHSGRIPGGSGRAGSAPGRRADGFCADGAPPLPQGALSAQVKNYVAAHPGEEFTPGQVTNSIGARSSGAVLNALVKLSTTNAVSEVAGASRRTFRAVETPESRAGDAAA